MPIWCALHDCEVLMKRSAWVLKVPPPQFGVEASVDIRSRSFVQRCVDFGLKLLSRFLPSLSRAGGVYCQATREHLLYGANRVLYLSQVVLQSQNHGVFEPSFPFGSSVELLWALYYPPQVLRSLVEHAGRRKIVR